MRKAYREIMDKVEVTEEMRNRVLGNLAAQSQKPPAKIVKFPVWKGIASIAACFVLLLVGGVVIRNVTTVDPDLSGEYVANPVAQIVACSSIEELSQTAGFSVEELHALPFAVQSTSYEWCWDKWAEVTYTGKKNSVEYRKAVGTEDISGDYTEYVQITTETVHGVEVTIKGNDDRYRLAVWQSEGYMFSVWIEQGIPYSKMIDLVQSAIS